MRSPLPRTDMLCAGAMTLAGTIALTGVLVTMPTTASAAPGDAAAPADAAPATASVVINEIESSGGSPDDWVELGNPTAAPIDASGMVLRDDQDSDTFVLPAGSTIAAGGFLTLDTQTATTPDGFDFGLGKADSVRLFESDGTTLVDSYTWTAHATTTYGRIPDFTGAFATTTAPTKNTTNVPRTTPTDPPTDPADPTDPPTNPGTTAGSSDARGLAINEVESNGDDTDWVELTNTSSIPIDVSSSGFVDGDTSHAPYVLPTGSVVAPGGFLVIDQATSTDPEGFTFGLGAADSVNLLDPDGTLDLTWSWTTHSAVTYGRCSGSTDLVTTTTSTKGTANDCSSPIRINEVESSGGSPDDWVELTNTGVVGVDVSGYVFRDDEDADGYTIPAGTSIAPGAFLVLDTKSDAVPTGFDFGLGSADSARLFLPDGTTPVDAYSWTSHAATTYGRNPDGTGAFATTEQPTKGAPNRFADTVVPTEWPGSPDETPLDAEDTYTGDLSGLDYEPSGSAAPGTIWGVENGTGRLYRIVADGQGGWAPSTTSGWADGKVLHHADGTGTVDAEGVTVADDSSAGGVYVSSERDNDVSTVSRPAVLQYDVGGTPNATTLNATAEWNLAPDFPGLGANAGLEGVTWIPDSFLTSKGFADQATGAPYAPATYPGHGDGLFFVGVEGTASVYVYALMTNGSFERIATIATSFPVVADVQFDADLGELWVVCDDACSGQTALFSLDAAGAFTQETLYDRPANADPALANEGFAIAPAATAVDGARATFYADDNDTDGFSFREGTYPSAVVPPADDPGTPGTPGTGGTGAGAVGGGTVTGDVGTGGTITVRPTGSRSAGDPALAFTGSEPVGAALLGGLLVALGIGAALLRRRRRA